MREARKRKGYQAKVRTVPNLVKGTVIVLDGMTVEVVKDSGNGSTSVRVLTGNSAGEILYFYTVSLRKALAV